MVCQSCQRLTRHRLLCNRCRASLRLATDRSFRGITVVSAFEHTGPARDLIHRAKYQGLTDYLDLAAAVVASRVPQLDVVPVPRAVSRLVRFGVDPALELASRLAEIQRTRVRRALRAPLHTPRRAGGDHRRRVDRYLVTDVPQAPVLLVDDVFTTGTTLEAALRSLGPERVHGAVAANVVLEVSSLLRRSDPQPAKT